ncbi:MAG: rRNA pseudouridine synthase [Clostridia bacterium]|nr:rRNA pseudouridine synthase [Clostridia bacterium]
MKERLQKILSAAGICSRRAAETYITEGRVKVNGITANLGESADPDTDEILVDGRPLGKKAPRLTYIMLNKPRGYVTTLSDEAGRKTVADLIGDVPERVYPVGRLDMHSEGLLLLTNDGQLAHSLMHPSHEVYKEYLVKLTPDEEGLPSPEKPLSGVIELDGERLLPAKCRLLSKTDNGYIMTISIRQGKNRQIRRMCAKCGYTVNSLKRVSEGDVKLADLPSGRWRYLTEAEVRYLKSL